MNIFDYVRMLIPIVCSHPQKYSYPYEAHTTVRPSGDGTHDRVSIRMTCTLCGNNNLHLKWIRLNDEARAEMGFPVSSRVEVE